MQPELTIIEIAPKAAPAAAAVPPRDWKIFFLGGLFVLALLAACHEASDIIFPIILAFFLNLVLQPAMHGMEKFRVPRTISALLLILLLAGAFVGIGTALSTPAASWTQELSDELPRLKEQVNLMRAPMKPIQNVLNGAQDLAGPKDPKTTVVTVQGATIADQLLQHTQHFASGLLEVIVVLFFMLVSGDVFLRRLVEVLPRFQDKKQAVHISNQIQSDISAYLITITGMNIMVGAATAIIMLSCGVKDAALWGLMATLLNFIPIIGPIIALGLFAIVGITVNADIATAFLPAGLYFGVHIFEGEFATPMLLAKRFTLNPVLLILSIIFWYWMWGMPGAILSTPMLAITKIVCDRIQSLNFLGHLIEG